ncbi:MAG: GWxTD domain-containing protein [Flavobacteriales bacterium]|nr:GWxTD domain-containing protein [Flavobacteriales bacterium]
MMRSKFFIFILLLSACTFGKKNNLQNRAFIYTESIKKTLPLFKVYNDSKTSSTLYCKIKTGDFLSVYSASKKENKISYSLAGILCFQGEDIAVDSFSISKNIATDTIAEINEKISLQTKEGEKYVLKIKLTDNHKISTTNHSIIVDKTNINKGDFLVYDKENQLQFNNYFNISDTLFIQNNTKQKTIFVKYYKEIFPLAKPPFIVGEIKSKKIKAANIFSLTTDTTFFILPINEKGIYQILDKEEAENGMSILSFENDFPKINTANDMISPLQYISSNEELFQLQEIKNPKIAIDEFWLGRTKGDKEQAKKIISTFYKRVENANTFFTSYKAGWKTDRGMIMIIFGPPNIIYQSEQGESWIYGEKNNVYSLNFTFTKMENKFTDNDYQLNRSVYFKSIWNTAQNAWRDGHIYSDIDIKEKIYEQERRQRQSQLYFWY